METKKSSRFINVIKKVLIFLLIVLIAIQFIRPERNNGLAQTNTDYTHYLNVPDSVHKILSTSCFDCHSNHTNYPWYSQVNPIGLWLHNHIVDGKRHLNFSDFSKYDAKRIDRKLEETAELVEEREMPLTSYTLVHRDAKLNDSQIKMIVDWTKAERSRLAVTK